LEGRTIGEWELAGGRLGAEVWPLRRSVNRESTDTAANRGDSSVQNGLTITKVTMTAAAIPGTSFMIRNVRFSSGRFPAFSDLP
jgi:hypothetical protein